MGLHHRDTSFVTTLGEQRNRSLQVYRGAIWEQDRAEGLPQGGMGLAEKCIESLDMTCETLIPHEFIGRPGRLDALQCALNYQQAVPSLTRA